jgi:hypothetical protein
MTEHNMMMDYILVFILTEIKIACIRNGTKLVFDVVPVTQALLTAIQA